MTFALLPVKDPRQAKQRLDGFLAPAEREALARVMFTRMLETLRAARGIDSVVVVTTDGQTARQAVRAGVIVLREDRQISHRDSAGRACHDAMPLGATTAVLLPIDVPLATPAEIEEIVAAAPRPGVLIVPSLDGTGTNALVLTPPDAIAARFGPGSFQAHLDAARGLEVVVRRPAGLLLDIDTPEDVAELLRRAPDSPIAQLLRGKWTSAS